MMINRAVTGSILLCFLAISSYAVAEQRALLVGVGKYSAPGNDLPGIALDIDLMRDTLVHMGFKDSQIKSLLDEQATAANVKAAIGDWLTKGVKPSDRVVFYFSGHGSNVPDFDGDEPDGVDEVLVSHDVRLIKRQGKRSLSGVVLDDELNALLNAIPSKNILTIVDACHSGTSTRSFNLDDKSLAADPVFVKSFIYDGMPEGDQSIRTRSAAGAAEQNFVSISAAGDDEKAIGTSKGGMFTIGLAKAITESASAGENATIHELRDKAASYIEERLHSSRVHHPQVTGNTKLAAGALRIVPVAEGNGPNRKKLTEMVQEQAAGFKLESTSAVYEVDEPVVLKMEIPMDGFLNVVTVDAHDNAIVLFPNQYHADNAVKAGSFSIPTKNMAFDLPAAEPLGPTFVAAFVTQDPISFYEQTLDERDADGNVNVEFTSLSHVATRAIKVAPRKKEMRAEQIELTVVAKQ